MALFLCLRHVFLNGFFGSVILAFWLAANGLDLVMAVFFMTGRKNLRTNDRFDVQMPAEITYLGRESHGVTENISETGLSVITKEPVYVPYEKEHAVVHLKSREYEAWIKCRAVHVRRVGNGWLYGLQIMSLEGENKKQYYQMLYDRHHGLAEQGMMVRCVLAGPERGRYRIENQRELLLSESFGGLFCQDASRDIAMEGR